MNTKTERGYLFVPIDADLTARPEDVMALPIWVSRAEALAEHAKLDGAVEFVDLELPQGMHASWIIRVDGVPVRGVAQWMVDQDRWFGRLDIAYRR